jgi:hypothetical protein
MREYLAASVHLASHAAHSRVTQKFTPTLRNEVSWRCHRRWITSIWFLRDAERACLVELASVLVPAVFSSGEMTRNNESLFVLQHGMAVLRGRILKPGKVRETTITSLRTLTHAPPIMCTTRLTVRSGVLPLLKVWGDDLILSNPALRRASSHVRALSAYMEVLTLEREALFELLERFPCAPNS